MFILFINIKIDDISTLDERNYQVKFEMKY